MKGETVFDPNWAPKYGSQGPLDRVTTAMEAVHEAMAELEAAMRAAEDDIRTARSVVLQARAATWSIPVVEGGKP